MQMNNRPRITVSRMEIRDAPLKSRPRLSSHHKFSRRISVFVSSSSAEPKGRISLKHRDKSNHNNLVMGRSASEDDDAQARARAMGLTVGIAPSFRSAERAEKRREYYIKLEQRQRALEAEKLESEMRAKEEEEAALKEFRKSLFVKAHPVPSFYREGPPPKVEPKKMPVTRAKSPKLTRGRSCNDSTHSSREDKGSCSRSASLRSRSVTPSSIRNK